MDKTNLTFEQALDELEKISEKISNEETTLDDALALYEKGIKLSKFCSDTLKSAKQKIISLNDAQSEEKPND